MVEFKKITSVKRFDGITKIQCLLESFIILLIQKRQSSIDAARIAMIMFTRREGRSAVAHASIIPGETGRPRLPVHLLKRRKARAARSQLSGKNSKLKSDSRARESLFRRGSAIPYLRLSRTQRLRCRRDCPAETSGIPSLMPHCAGPP